MTVGEIKAFLADKDDKLDFIVTMVPSFNISLNEPKSENAKVEAAPEITV